MFHNPQHAGKLLERGVHVEPFLGPNGETILVAIDHQHRQLGDRVLVRPGDNHVGASDALWDRIERDDPYFLAAI